MKGKVTRGRKRLQMLSDVISKSYEELKRERLKTEVGERKGRHKPAIWQKTEERDNVYCVTPPRMCWTYYYTENKLQQLSVVTKQTCKQRQSVECSFQLFSNKKHNTINIQTNKPYPPLPGQAPPATDQSYTPSP